MILMKEMTEEILRKNGLRATKPRVAIYNYLKSVHTHPTVEEIYENLKKRMHNVSYATVYNVLNEFVKSGLAKEISTFEDAKRYDGNIEPHIHFICKKCGKIEDIMLNEEPNFVKELEGSGYLVKEVSVNIYGICKDCLKKESN